ncbi:related to VPS71-nucleosome-binding component of the SWR1 complex [Ustilago bromivora]|uniref:Related to VPS71-nucleosome-binding component of the SWR1 complex n=1 Tax=Ustilago bromivora TaxID=307758 RepID=A0A1K0H623_9BASI|nr:related to VPS71-nucleosome-binding component of the SWR1 complex [Ustilago bromivora]
MSASVSLRKRRSVASRPITNRPQTITGQQNKLLNEEQERERQAKELDARRRRARRRLDELERINYRDAPTASAVTTSTSDPATSNANEIVAAFSAETDSAATGAAGVSLAQRRRNQAELRRILVSGRRNLHSMVEELVDQARLPLRGGKPNWRTARSGLSEKPGRKYCSICGFHGDLSCIRCGHRYCSRKCRDVHDETRCERPLR